MGEVPSGHDGDWTKVPKGKTLVAKSGQDYQNFAAVSGSGFSLAEGHTEMSLSSRKVICVVP